MQFYTKLLALLVVATAATGILTSLGIYFGVTSTFQATLATIIVAFAGFIFGGLYPFVLGGRRLQWRDREKRIEKYHVKLREHVFDFWTNRSVEPRVKMEDLPDSREGLYIFLDLGSDRDPDGRYLESSLSHLEDESYKKTAEERETILDRAKTHNEKVAAFVNTNNSILEKAKSLGLREGNMHPSDKLESTSELFNRAGIFDFLDSSYNYPSDTRLKPEVLMGGHFLKYDSQTLTYTIARSLNREKIQALLDALVEFASKYVETRQTLRAEITSLEGSLTEFKSHAMTIGHDINDEELEGTCDYEARTRKRAYLARTNAGQ